MQAHRADLDDAVPLFGFQASGFGVDKGDGLQVDSSQALVCEYGLVPEHLIGGGDPRDLFQQPLPALADDLTVTDDLTVGGDLSVTGASGSGPGVSAGADMAVTDSPVNTARGNSSVSR